MSIPARYILALALCGLLPSLAAATPSPRTLAADSLDRATRAAPRTPAAFNETTPSVEPSRIASGGVPGLSLHEIEALGPDAIKAVLTVRSIARTGTPPSAIDNDYTRLNLALQSAAASSTIELDGRFDQLDIMAALNANTYLQGPYAAVQPTRASRRMRDVVAGLVPATSLGAHAIRLSSCSAQLNEMPGTKPGMTRCFSSS